MTINVKEIDKEDLLLILYNNAKPLGMGFFQANNKLMTREEAGSIIKQECQPNSCDFDYLNGRPIKTDISGDEVDLRLYKRDNTHVVIENIINDFKESKTHTQKAINLRPSKEQDYIPFFTVKLAELASKINPHTGHTDLSSMLAGYDLAEKCNNIKYDDSYSKKTLISYDLYPWEWAKNSEKAVNSLCSIVGGLKDHYEQAAAGEINNIFDNHLDF